MTIVATGKVDEENDRGDDEEGVDGEDEEEDDDDDSVEPADSLEQVDDSVWVRVDLVIE